MKRAKFIKADALYKKIAETTEHQQKISRLSADLAILQEGSLTHLIIQYQKEGKTETTHCNVRKEALCGILKEELLATDGDIKRMEAEFDSI